MGDRHPQRIWPKAVQSVGQMRDLGARVAAFCPDCRTMFRIDLEAIIHARGRSYSLIDQRGPCRRYDCDGRAFFMFSAGRGVPFVPLATEAGDLAWMFPDPPAPDEPDPPPCNPPPRAPAGVSLVAWAAADSRERQRLVRKARG